MIWGKKAYLIFPVSHKQLYKYSFINTLSGGIANKIAVEEFVYHTPVQFGTSGLESADRQFFRSIPPDNKECCNTRCGKQLSVSVQSLSTLWLFSRICYSLPINLTFHSFSYFQHALMLLQICCITASLLAVFRIRYLIVLTGLLASKKFYAWIIFTVAFSLCNIKLSINT